MKPTPVRALYLLLAVAMVVLATWAFWPRAIAVDVGEVARGPLTVSFTEEGRTRLRDRYLVSAPMDGFVERILLEPGDEVAAGTQVAVLLPSTSALLDPATRADAQARWHAADGELDAALAAVTAATALQERMEAAQRRAEALERQALIASDQLDEVRAQADAARAGLRSAKARAQAARIVRDGARAVLSLQGSTGRRDGKRVPLQSPIEGRVIRRLVESEGPVRSGQPLLELGDPRALEVVVEALTPDALRVAPGTPVRLLRWGGDRPLMAEVETVEPGGFTKVSALGVEEQRVLIVVGLPDIQPYPNLGDGFRVEAEFQVWSAKDTLCVPVSALVRDGEQWAVFTIERGRARLRHLRVGQMGDEAAQVLGGLKAGTQVVLYPGDDLHDGVRVQPRLAEMPRPR